MAYVPPALRRKQEAAAKGERLDEKSPSLSSPSIKPATFLPSIHDIQNHFWPTKEELVPSERHNRRFSDRSFQPSELSVPTNSQETKDVEHVDQRLDNDEELKLRVSHPHSTLNSAEAEPDKLKYVLLFTDAHPRWNTDQIIYAKSELHLLPQQSSPSPTQDAKQSSPQSSTSPPEPTKPQPLATNVLVFDQSTSQGSRGASNARFEFIGRYNLTHLQILEPNTPELVRMLEQKWTRTTKYGKARQINRDAASWKKSMSYRWAVLKFEKDEVMTKDLGSPKIEISKEDGNEVGRRKENVPLEQGKSVNEMLRSLRMKDEGKTEKVDDAEDGQLGGEKT